MKRFSFRLQKVLDVNEIREEQAQKRLGEAERARGLQEASVDRAESAVSSQIDEQRSHLKKGIAAGDAAIYHRYGMQLRKDVAEEKRRLVEANERVSDRRKELAEIARKRKSLETLRDRKREEFDQENNVREMNELDEIATRRFIAANAANELNA